jgi:hypothetical protein
MEDWTLVSQLPQYSVPCVIGVIPSLRGISAPPKPRLPAPRCLPRLHDPVVFHHAV